MWSGKYLAKMSLSGHFILVALCIHITGFASFTNYMRLGHWLLSLAWQWSPAARMG